LQQPAAGVSCQLQQQQQQQQKQTFRHNKKYKHPLTFKNTQISWVNTN
jgi:hypothetical protein